MVYYIGESLSKVRIFFVYRGMAILSSLSASDRFFSFFHRPFSQKGQGFLGLDIGSSSIKGVELVKKGAQALLKTYGEVTIPEWRREHGLTEGNPGVDELAMMVRDLLKAARADSRDAYVSMPVARSFIIPTEFPKHLSDDELARAIPFEARRFIPSPLEEVVLNWRIIGGEGRDDAVKTRVLLIALPKDTISSLHSIVEKAGLNFRGVELETYSIIRAGILPQEKKEFLLFDFGAMRTTLALVVGGEIYGLQSITQGTVDLVVSLARSLSVNSERAEELMRTHGVSGRSEEREIGQVISPLIDRLIEQAKRMMSDLAEEFGRTVERTLLVGGGSRMPGLPEYLTESMGIEARALDSFRRVVYPPTVEPIIRQIVPSMGPAVGLALKGFGL